MRLLMRVVYSVLREDLVISDDIFGVVLELLKYFSGSTCTTLLMRIHRRATMRNYGFPTILIFILSSRSCNDYVWLNVGIIGFNSTVLKGNLQS